MTMGAHVDVESSHVQSIAYDPDTQTVEARFKHPHFGNGSVWQYSPISQDEFDAMLFPGNSVGRMLHVARNRPGVTSIKIEAVSV